MENTETIYVDNLKKTFDDFLTHDLIALEPFSLTEQEIWDGIKKRANLHPYHQCDLINRMNGFCTLLTLVGHRSVPTNYNTADYGVFKYTYNDSEDKNLSEIEILYSCFCYPLEFCDIGFLSNSFGGNGKVLYLTVDIIYNGLRQSKTIVPDSLFGNPVNKGSHCFLEYNLLAQNKFNSNKQLPFIVNIDESDSSFIEQVRISLLKTKFVLLSLVEQYPYHLMHQPPISLLTGGSKSIENTFNDLYSVEVKGFISSKLEETKKEMVKRNLSFKLPF